MGTTQAQIDETPHGAQIEAVDLRMPRGARQGRLRLQGRNSSHAPRQTSPALTGELRLDRPSHGRVSERSSGEGCPATLDRTNTRQRSAVARDRDSGVRSSGRRRAVRTLPEDRLRTRVRKAALPVDRRPTGRARPEPSLRVLHLPRSAVTRANSGPRPSALLQAAGKRVGTGQRQAIEHRVQDRGRRFEVSNPVTELFCRGGEVFVGRVRAPI